MAGFQIVAGGGPQDQREEHDFYPTPPQITLALLMRETFPGVVWEPCAGKGHLANALRIGGVPVVTSELYDYDFRPDYRLDFIAESTWRAPPGVRSVVTNPPYVQALAFIQKAIALGIEKHAWLLRFQFIEGIDRYDFFMQHPPARIHVFSRRVQISERGLIKHRGGMIVFAWWIWERGFKGRPEIHWINPEDI